MDNYPRIYSINTVGIRQHYNSDYLLHPIRTDFTGKNGVGKSIIADLLQLIFIPQRDDWKSGGTDDSSGKNLRKIETIPLQRNYIQFAYAFVNIEKSKGRFVTIGVYIPRNTTPLRPFIVSANPDVENIKSYSKPLFSSDFIGADNQVLNITNEEVARHLHSKHDLFLHSFYQNEGIIKYHSLLYNNLILDIDLTKHSNYQSFAKVLQSFARAKTLNISKSASLKEFLFEDNAFIKKLFDNQKVELIDRMKQYRETDNQIQLLSLKQNALAELKKLETNQSEVFLNFLKADTSYSYYLYVTKKDEKEKNEIKLQKADENQIKLTKEKQELVIEIQKKELEFKKADKAFTILNEYSNLFNEFQLLNEEPNRINSKLIDLQGQLTKDQNEIEKFKKDIEIVKLEIPTEKTIAEKEELQKQYDNKIQKLLKFENFKSYNDLQSLQNAYENNNELFTQTRQKIESDIKLKSELLELFTNKKSNSLFNWAIKNEKSLDTFQESILMHFKSIYTAKPNTFDKFILNPDILLNSKHEIVENKGFWIKTGEINEFIHIVKKQVFENPKTLIEIIEKEQSQINQEISTLKTEINDLKNHKINILKKYSINFDLLQFPIFEQLKELFDLNQEDLKEHFTQAYEKAKQEYKDLFTKNVENTKEYKRLEKEISEITKKIEKNKTEIQEKVNLLETLQNNIKTKQVEISNKKAEIDFEFETEHVKQLISDFKKEKESIVNEQKTLSEKNEKLQERIEQLISEISGCKTSKTTLENDFEKAKKIIESKLETYRNKTNFEYDIQTKEYSFEEVTLLKSNFDTAEETYKNRYFEVVNQFEESQKNKTEIQNSNFNFYSLESVLLGSRIKHFDKISEELKQLNETVNTFANLQKEIVLNVFTSVDSLYKEYEKQINKLNLYFINRKISDDFTLNIEFKPKKSINKIDGKNEPIINWVRRMKESAKSRDLFTEQEKPEKLIETIVEKFYDTKTIDFNELINPKTYFELETKFIDKNGVPHPPSSGQGYTVIVLICIARIFVIKQTDNVHKGIKFVILEEIGTLDDVNFELATKDGFQVITMNPRPYSVYSEQGAFVHMLTKGKENSDINYKQLSVFKKKGIQEDLQEYILNSAKK